MTAKTAYVVDFDGTVTAVDLSTGLARHFGGERFRKIESLYRQRKIGMRGWLDGMSALLPADFDLLMAYVADHAVIRPGFQDFVRFAREQGRPVAIASDGFGFYIEPVLERFGCLEYIDTIYCNKALPREDGTLRIEIPYRHPTCTVCGNCKPNHAELKRQGWKVIYIGDGSNDRFGASWSDYILPATGWPGLKDRAYLSTLERFFDDPTAAARLPIPSPSPLLPAEGRICMRPGPGLPGGVR